jgi:osmotically-inducible protein OsmY
MNNPELEGNVSAELFWDPKIDSEAVAVSTDDGIVTLRGTVGSFRQKREAKTASERVFGVTRVNNDLDVRILTDQRRDDADLRGDVLQALMLDDLVPTAIDASVQDGSVTLSGSAEWQYQRDEAEFITANILGVTDIENDIDIVPPTPSAKDVEKSITNAMERGAKLDANNVSVKTSSGTATLTGTVRSFAEHDAAVDAAWSAPGITSVDDRIDVFY